MVKISVLLTCIWGIQVYRCLTSSWLTREVWVASVVFEVTVLCKGWFKARKYVRSTKENVYRVIRKKDRVQNLEENHLSENKHREIIP